MTQQQLQRMREKCKTQPENIVAHLWNCGTWLPTHQLQNVHTPFGFIGSAGHTRVRELARNACVIKEELHNKVEKKRGGAIGLDPKYEYFRYKAQPAALAREDHLRIAREAVAAFDAAL